jgi:hypothetical protein
MRATSLGFNQSGVWLSEDAHLQGNSWYASIGRHHKLGRFEGKLRWASERHQLVLRKISPAHTQQVVGY